MFTAGNLGQIMLAQTIVDRILPGALGLLGGIALLIIVAAFFRRWRRAGAEDRSTWTLNELQEMRDRAELSQEEYQHLLTKSLDLGARPAGTGNADQASAKGRSERLDDQ